MNKEKEQAQEQPQQAQQPASEAAATVSGASASNTTAPVSGASASEVTNPVILRAKSREEIDQQFQQLKAKHNGHTLTAGAVARNSDDGTYILRVDIL